MLIHQQDTRLQFIFKISQISLTHTSIIFILHFFLQSQPPGLEDQHAAVYVPGPEPAEPCAWHCTECSVP